MRTFEHYPAGTSCPICGKNHDSEAILIPIIGTEEGNNMQAIPVHTECLQKALSYSKELGLIIAKADKNKL